MKKLPPTLLLRENTNSAPEENALAEGSIVRWLLPHIFLLVLLFIQLLFLDVLLRVVVFRQQTTGLTESVPDFTTTDFACLLHNTPPHYELTFVRLSQYRLAVLKA